MVIYIFKFQELDKGSHEICRDIQQIDVFKAFSRELVFNESFKTGEGHKAMDRASQGCLAPYNSVAPLSSVVCLHLCCTMFLKLDCSHCMRH
jgi:hypothetical protein